MSTDKKTDAGKNEKDTSKMGDSAGKSNDGLTNKLQGGDKKAPPKK